jgi:hypothetical protein
MATHPQGMGPQAKAQLRTSNEQSAGGGQSSATGQGALLGARLKNPGAASNAIAESARSSGENLSKANLGTDLADEQLKEKQRTEGVGGLQNFALGGLGAVAPNVNANSQAEEQSWDWASKVLGPVLSAAGGAASGGLSQGGRWAKP